jgi:hypothetical protein
LPALPVVIQILQGKNVVQTKPQEKAPSFFLRKEGKNAEKKASGLIL